MMTKKVFHILVLVLVLVPSLLQSKSKRIKYGKIDQLDLQAVVCPIDSAAHAYYLLDKGRCEYVFNRSFEIKMTRHLRIKVLDDEALDLAAFSFEIFKSNDFVNYAIEDIKGQTYNWVDGAMVVSELDEDSISRMDKDKYSHVVSFVMPDVKAGSVIELCYTQSTRQLDQLMSWQFQYDIPVLLSEYSVEIPEYFKYKQFPYGDVDVTIDQLSSTGKIVFARNAEFLYVTDVMDYRAENVPAYARKGTRPMSDLGTRVEFELSGSYVSDMLRDMIAEDFRKGLRFLDVTEWKEVQWTLSNSVDFGKRLSKVQGVYKIMSDITLSADSLTNIQAAFDAIKSTLLWNGHRSCYALKPLDKSIKKKKGNAAEVNLTLVALLRAMGLEAYPVVLSTVDNGFVRTYKPSVSVFNYAIAACVCQGEVLLMDATGDVSQVNELPKRCQNGEGLMIKDYSYQWVSLMQECSED